MVLKDDETELLKRICAKHRVPLDAFLELLSIEEEYAHRNASRRVGIYTRMDEAILKWIKKEDDGLYAV